MAREWAKLRWGVYDELPRDPDRESYYYYTNRKILPTICSSAIAGWLSCALIFQLQNIKDLKYITNFRGN